MQTTDEFLTPYEVSTELRVTPQAVYNWLQDGKLKGYKAGSVWRIKRSDIDAFISTNKAER